MKITIEGTPEEIKEMLQAIASSKEQALKNYVSAGIDERKLSPAEQYDFFRQTGIFPSQQ